jgi:phospholipid/cholesterol/gamma-HCH transport system permease protein
MNLEKPHCLTLLAIMEATKKSQPESAALRFESPAEDTLRVVLSGLWKLGHDLPLAEEIQKQIESDPKVQRIRFDADDLTGWDSGLLTFLIKIKNACSGHKIILDSDGLPEGVKRLLALASAVPEKKDTGRAHAGEPFLSRIGSQVIEALRSTGEMVAFIGEATLAFTKLLGGKARFRRSDLILVIQECGAEALPIVTLISVLIGLILAFMGAVQLKLFGAEIYIASLVAIGMTREMGAMMAAIIMAGRTGAAFAAQLGTMQVNEEIDALKTLGISPMEFLVLPRMLALILMMPLLCIYADLMGMLGGFVVGVGAFDITITQYFEETSNSLTLAHILIGIFKAGIFGILIAVAGCLRGMQCGRSAMEVGYAATSAVVTAIVWIILADGLFALITNVLGI